MAKKTARQIVEESLPDMEIVDSPPKAAADSVRPAAEPGASMAELRKKYLGPDAADEADAVAEEDVEVKQVRAKKTPADPADDPGPRTVIISKNKGILGSQG
jgi:hypothetical protein